MCSCSTNTTVLMSELPPPPPSVCHTRVEILREVAIMALLAHNEGWWACRAKRILVFFLYPFQLAHTSHRVDIFVEEAGEGSGMGSVWLGAICRIFCRKTQMGPTKYSSPGGCLCQIGRQFLSVVDNSEVWGKWYGMADCLLFQS